MDKLRNLLQSRFGADRIEVAWIGGSATWAAAVPEVEPGIPAEDVLHLSGVETPWGALGRFRIVNIEGRPLIRIPVHGWRTAEGKFRPSPEASLRVFFVLRELGVRLVLVDASVGGITIGPGDILIEDDLIDLVNKPYAHEFAQRLGLVPWLRLAQPYCPQIRERLRRAAYRLFAQGPAAYRPLSGTLHTEGAYVTTPFGIFESALEIREYKREGGSVVGQSAGLETMLARLCGMHLGHISVAANWAEGQGSGAWSGEGDMAAFYWACTRPMARLCWDVVRSLVLEGVEAEGCACESIMQSTDLSGLPVPEA